MGMAIRGAGKVKKTSPMKTELRVAEFYSSCATRGRGKKFYPKLSEWALKSASTSVRIVSFEGVSFVSPAFLDETVIRLAREKPELVTGMSVSSLQPMARERLRAICQKRDLPSPEISA